jgi:hypothetical protein
MFNSNIIASRAPSPIRLQGTHAKDEEHCSESCLVAYSRLLAHIVATCDCLHALLLSLLLTLLSLLLMASLVSKSASKKCIEKMTVSSQSPVLRVSIEA